MSLRATTGNTVKGIGEKISSFINTAKNTVDNIIGTVTTRAGSIWSGGFSGMKESGKDELKTAMQQYITTVSDIINNFNAEGEISNALKGTALEDSVHAFLASMKKLFTAYVEVLELEQKELDEAYNKWTVEGQKNLSEQVLEHKKDIEELASEVELD